MVSQQIEENNCKFEGTFRCYLVTFFEKSESNYGNKIVMPTSCFKTLIDLGLEYPFMFEIVNCKNKNKSHCGVIEFSSLEGMGYLPSSMMCNLGLVDGDVIYMCSARIPPGTYLKIKPHTMDFLSIEDHKGVLECSLRKYTCLTVGECIVIHHNEIKYNIDILDAEPEKVISVIETDCKVEFAAPLHMGEGDKPTNSIPANLDESTAGAGSRLNSTTPSKSISIQFKGLARRLNGTPFSETKTKSKSSNTK